MSNSTINKFRSRRKYVTTMRYHNTCRVFSQNQRIFERRVATADDQDLFAPDVIFRLLTRDQNAATAKFIFALNAELSPSDAGGKHQILAPKFGTVYQDYDLF